MAKSAISTTGATAIVGDLALSPAAASFVTGFALATIPSRYALERGRWGEAASLTLSGKEFPWSRFPQSEAQLVFARALGAARGGDVAAARRDIDRLGAALSRIVSTAGAIPT